MKRLIVSFCVTFFLGLTATTYGQDDAPLSDGAVAIYNIIADSPDAYAETQRDNSQLFEEMGILIAGVCTAISGNEYPGEIQFFSMFPSVSSAFSGLEYTLTNSEVKDLQADLASSRKLLNTETMLIVKGYDGEIYENWATRSVYVSPADPAAYLEGMASLEKAFHDNGFSDTNIMVYQTVASGATSSHVAVAVAPSLARLGEMFDTLASETWAQEAYAAILASRPVPVSDKAYSCQQVFSAI